MKNIITSDNPLFGGLETYFDFLNQCKKLASPEDNEEVTSFLAGKYKVTLRGGDNRSYEISENSDASPSAENEANEVEQKATADEAEQKATADEAGGVTEKSFEQEFRDLVNREINVDTVSSDLSQIDGLLSNALQNESDQEEREEAVSAHKKVSLGFLESCLIAKPSLVNERSNFNLGNGIQSEMTLLDRYCLNIIPNFKRVEILVNSGADLFALTTVGDTKYTPYKILIDCKHYLESHGLSDSPEFGELDYLIKRVGDLGEAYFSAFYPDDADDEYEKAVFSGLVNGDHPDSLEVDRQLNIENGLIRVGEDRNALPQWQKGFFAKNAVDSLAKRAFDNQDKGNFVKYLKLGASTKGLWRDDLDDGQKELLRFYGACEETKLPQEIGPKTDNIKLFRDLARLVKEAHLAGKTEKQIDSIIDQFGKDHVGFKVSNLKAADMIAFMTDIDISVPNQGIEAGLGKKIGDSAKFLSSAPIDGSEDGLKAEDRKQFYNQLLQVSFDEDNSFVSDNVEESGRQALIKYLSEGQRDKDHVLNYYFLSKVEDFKQKNKISSPDAFSDLSLIARYHWNKRNKLQKELAEDANLISFEESLVNVLFAGTNSLEAKELVHFNVNEIDPNPTKIVSDTAVVEEKAAIHIQNVFKERRLGSKISNSETFKQSAIDAKKYRGLGFQENEEVEFDIGDENEITKGEYSRVYEGLSYSKGSLEKTGKKAKIYHGGTGLIVHGYEGVEGLNDLTDLYNEVSERKLNEDQSEVFIANVKNFPVHDEEVDLHCLIINDSHATSKTFITSEEYQSITQRSEELYQRNLKIAIAHNGAEASIALINDFRHFLIEGPLKEEIVTDPAQLTAEEKQQVLGYYSKFEVDLRLLLQKTKINDSDSPEEVKRKENLLVKEYDKLSQSYFGKSEELDQKVQTLANVDSTESQLKNLNALNYFLDKNFSTEDQRLQARLMTSRSINQEIAQKAKQSTKENQYKFAFDGLDKAEIIANFLKENDRWYDPADLSGFKESTKKDLDQILSVKMPYSPYKGVSISRPKGYNKGHAENSLVCVTFNGEGEYDNAWIGLAKNKLDTACRGYYIKVSRCDEDSKRDVYVDGVLTKKDCKKGDILIDTGVVYRKADNGDLEMVKISSLDDTTKKALQGRFNDMRIVAMTIDDNKQRSEAAVLLGGKTASCHLDPKVSIFQNEQEIKKSAEILQQIKFRCDKDSKFIDEKEVKAVVYGSEGFDIGVSVKPNTDNNTDQKLASTPAIPSTPATPKETDAEFGNKKEYDTRVVIGYDSPEITYVNKDKNKFSFKLFDKVGDLTDDAVRHIPNMTGNGQFVGFLSDKLNLSKSEIEHFRDNPLVDPDKTKEFVKNVAEKIKELCQKTKIGVAYEECERKGFQLVKDEHGEVVKKPDGSDLKKDVYKPTGKREEVIYGNEKKEPPKSEYQKFTDSMGRSAKSFVATVKVPFSDMGRGG